MDLGLTDKVAIIPVAAKESAKRRPIAWLRKAPDRSSWRAGQMY